MKITFVGGGSFMTLPIVRAALADPRILQGGEICLYDPAVDRAEAMGRMIARTPEYRGVNCKITWDATLDEAIAGADIVRVGFPCGSEVQWRAGTVVCHNHGFIGSDQLSPTGAFLALKGGPILLDIARRMERLAPEAWLLIFANPVAVYSTMVNTYTSIRALGICGGFKNHMWDLTRLMGRDEERAEYDVDVAGVNHLSFITHGTHQGRDLFEVLRERITPNWAPPAINGDERFQRNITQGLERLVKLFRDFGVMVFSTEGDGIGHIFHEDAFANRPEQPSEPNISEIETAAAETREARRAENEKFRSHLNQELDDAFWAEAQKTASTFSRSENDVTVKIMSAATGLGRQKIVASRPNQGAIDGFTDRMAVEYSMFLDRDQVEPSRADLAVPAPFHGLISSLSMHQTLLADAIATEDPRALYEALYSYPVRQGSRESRLVYRRLLDINRTEIPEVFQQTGDYLKD